MSQPEFACSNIETKINNLTGTVTYVDHERESSFEQIWMRRICEVQGMRKKILNDFQKIKTGKCWNF
jgi:hypothetical protein